MYLEFSLRIVYSNRNDELNLIPSSWRYQIPPLLKAGYRVICPDIMGFGETDAPQVPPESIAFYGFKRAADDINELAQQLECKNIILGGHDWVSSTD